MTALLILLCSTVVWLTKGHYDPSVPLIVLAFLAWVYLTLERKSGPRFLEKGESLLRVLPWIGAVMIAIKPNVMYVSESLKSLFWFYRFLPSAVVTFTHFEHRFNHKYAKPFFGAGMLLFFLAVLYLSPNPFIDVYRSNDMAVDFFLRGLNPYSQTYPDIYGGGFDYHPGFLYWPGSLYLQTFSKLIFNDIRVILVLSWWIAAFLISENTLGRRYRKVWWSLPFLAFGFEQAWLDPLLSLCAAITLWSLKNRRWWFMALAIGVAASVKQYGFLIGAFAGWWLVVQRDWKNVVKVGMGSMFFFGAFLLPFVLWQWSDFVQMTVASHAGALARKDALNFTAFWMKTTGLEFSSIAQLSFTLLGFGLSAFHVLKNKSRGLSVIAESWAIAFGFSMMFGKFAFCNYYWLFISFLMLSLAFADDDKSRI